MTNLILSSYCKNPNTDSHLTRAFTVERTTLESRKRGVTRMWKRDREAKATAGERSASSEIWTWTTNVCRMRERTQFSLVSAARFYILELLDWLTDAEGPERRWNPSKQKQSLFSGCQNLTVLLWKPFGARIAGLRLLWSITSLLGICRPFLLCHDTSLQLWPLWIQIPHTVKCP